MNSKRVIHRSSETGRLVTKEFAQKNPRVTEREVVKVPSRSSEKSRKK